MKLLRGSQIGTLFKLVGRTVNDGYNSSVVPKSGAEKGKNIVAFRKKLCCGIKDYDISKRRAFEYNIVMAW